MKHNDIFRIAPRITAAAKADVAVMGMKAFELARMARLGLQVPPAFVLGTPHCRRWRQEPEHYRKALAGLLEEQLHWLQSVCGLGFGDSRRPLLVSVRSGAPVSMPGMMATVLNIGICEATIHGMLRVTGNPRLVWDSYRRLIQDFAEMVYDVDPQPFAAALAALLTRDQLGHFRELDYLSLAELTQTNLRLFQELTGKPFPQNPLDQLLLAVQAVFASWNSPRAVEYRRLCAVSDDLCTAATIQCMVFGNGGGRSGSGVGFTRDPNTGEKTPYVDFLFNSQGEDVVSGRATGSDTDLLVLALPEIRQELISVCGALEGEFRDAQEFEFTLQDGILHLLQTRSAKRTPWAALRIAVEQVKEGLIEKEEALARLDGLGFPLDAIRREQLCVEGKEPLDQGQPAGSGVASGPLALDVDAARRFSAEGRGAVLVRDEMATADITAIALAVGVLTARGNRTSHAAVVARQLGKPCITGCSGLRIDLARRVVEFRGGTLAEGVWVTIDSGTGGVFEGRVETIVDYPTFWLAEIRKWRQAVQPVKTAARRGRVSKVVD